MLDQIRIVLVNTSHPGNIGSAARAMKTMGLNQLYLVAPQLFPHPKAEELASGAKDVLENAKIVATLDEAIKDCVLVMGTSARSRKIPWPLFTPKEAAEKIQKEAKDHSIALIFGREQSGLTNEELQLCHFHIHIPANPEYSSLNLAAAVQILAYEIRMSYLNETVKETWDYRLATSSEMEQYFDHLQNVLQEIDFLKPSAPRKLMTRLRRLFLRTRPDVMEMNILRGMLTAISEKIKQS